MLKKLERLLPHGAILICNMYIVFFLIDRVNQAMNFIDNGLTKGLLLILCAIALFNAWRLLKPAPVPAPKPTAKPKPAAAKKPAPTSAADLYAKPAKKRTPRKKAAEAEEAASEAAPAEPATVVAEAGKEDGTDAE